MPKPKQRDNRFAASPRVHECLRSGLDVGYLDPNIGPPSALDGVVRLDLDLLRQAWGVLADELTAAWIEEKGAGHRCWAWWRWSAPEPRRRCLSGVHPFDEPARQARVRRIAAQPGTRPNYWADMHELSFGVPACVYAGELAIQYETEADYLQRFGLLSEQERQSLEEAD